MTAVIDLVLIDSIPGETRLCLLSQGRLMGLSIDRATRPSQVDSLVLGRVKRVVPKLRAAFVDVGGTRDGFLPLDDDLTVTEGEAIIVQVRRDPIIGQGEDKGPRLSANATLAGDLAVFEPYGDGVSLSRKISDPGIRDRLRDAAARTLGDTEGHVLVRTAAADRPEQELVDQVEALLDRWDEIEDEADAADPPAMLAPGRSMVSRMLGQVPADGVDLIVNDRLLLDQLGLPWSGIARVEREGMPLFQRHEVEEQIDALLTSTVTLPGGGSIIIQETAALTAIDVNLGGAPGGEDGMIQANLEAVTEIARQVVLRNLGGQIVVDFLRLRESESRRRLWARMDDAVDRWTRVLGWSRMGLLEMTRQRQGESLTSLMTSDCVVCGHGHARRSDTAAAFDLMRQAHARRGGRFSAAPGIAEVLKGRLGEYRRQLEQAIGSALVVDVDTGLPAGCFETRDGP